ncbi:MAG: alpha/beta fold hydrolase [Gemmatimonadetes bacterium]|nr:alpha/beta fold hydrolase [Gemmatimonadota bacterium]
MRDMLRGVLVAGMAVMSLEIAATPAVGQQIDGSWRGSVSVMGQVIPFVVHFATADGALGATIDIQGVSGLALKSVTWEHPAVHFELEAGPGIAVWDGELADDSIAGSFTQAGVTGTFSMVRAREDVGEEEPPPYGEEEVQFTNGEITLAGTLTVPPSPGPHPAVVMITGSGPQNRDEELFPDYKPFRVIADHLTRHGIAVLRYDDRGVGGSTGSVTEATSADFAGDVLAAVAFLRSRPEIAAGQIGVLGHSEGGIVGPLAATRSDDIAFVIMLAGPGLNGEQILYAQGELIVRAGGGDDDAVARQRALQQRIFTAIRTDRGWDEVRDMIAAQIEESLASMTVEQREAIEDDDAFIQRLVEAQIGQIRSKWFRFFIDHDPLPVLERVRVPILGLFGELDLQVPAEQNRDAIREALERSGHPDYMLRILPGVNHLFIPATTGSPSEYATLDKEFAPGFLDLIAEWILARTRAAPAP